MSNPVNPSPDPSQGFAANASNMQNVQAANDANLQQTILLQIINASVLDSLSKVIPDSSTLVQRIEGKHL